jgi:hypothetical protein
MATLAHLNHISKQLPVGPGPAPGLFSFVGFLLAFVDDFDTFVDMICF